MSSGEQKRIGIVGVWVVATGLSSLFGAGCVGPSPRESRCKLVEHQSQPTAKPANMLLCASSGQEPTTNESLAATRPAVDLSRLQASGPVLLWTETEYDFGTVFSGTMIEHEFEVMNISPVPARVQIAPRGSGSLSWFNIGPGETRRIPVKVFAPRASQEAQREYKLLATLVPLE